MNHSNILRLWSITIDADRISAVVTDGRHFDANFPPIPNGGCLVFLDGCLLPIPLGPDDTRLLADSMGGFHPR